eukprot:10326968-Alexandrium_andersonii.AAC.1
MAAQQLRHSVPAADATFYSTDHKTSEPPPLRQDVAYPHDPSWAHISLRMRRAPLALLLQHACLSIAVPECSTLRATC